MNYIVIDFEFNQSYDFEKNCKGNVNKNCTFEIIQIGAIKLDENFEEIDSFNVLIKPNIYRRIHPHVSKITGLNNEVLKNSKLFTEVYNDFMNFLGENYIFCIWGKMDIKILFRNLLYYNFDISKVSKQYLDVQALISKKITKSTQNLVGLQNACIFFDIDSSDRKFHDAFNDAYYTKELMLKANLSTKYVTNFRANELVKKTLNKKGKIDTEKIYFIAEKSLERELTDKERELVLTIYNLGRNRQCEAKEPK